MKSTKPFKISKWLVWEAWKRIKANGGSHGIDNISIEMFEQDVENNLYKIWNRLSSGSYFPPPVKRVLIPKGLGNQTRPLGIPTVADRVAQMVIKMEWEPDVDKHFHPDSYGYRPGKSAIEAVSQARQRCWKYSWVVDLDIKGFFDNIDHTLMMKAVEKHTECKWIRLYIERWLKAPVKHKDGRLEERICGTPQGGVISPLLANLFLHYTLDKWIGRQFQDVPFERYADDAIYHCRTQWQAERVLKAIQQRLGQCQLELHPEKTKIVYCKKSNRKGRYENISFDFLGFTFKPRKAKSKGGQVFTGFLPAVSRKARLRMNVILRKRKIPKRSGCEVEEIARMINPMLLGWFNYYGQFRQSALYQLNKQLDEMLIRWARKKHKRFKRSYKKSRAFIHRLRKQNPWLFAHWQFFAYG